MRERQQNMLVIGGSPDHPGGIEAFCERSAVALERVGGWNIDRVPADTAYLRLRDVPRLFQGLAGMLKYPRREYDYLWLQYGNMPDLAYLIVGKIMGHRIMVTPHLGTNWKSQANPLLRALSGLTLRMADRLALISRTQELEVNMRGRVPRSLIRNFLPEEILGLDLQEDREPLRVMQIIHSGRLSEGKGSFMVIDVCARLRDKGVPFRCRITGGADLETYERLDRMIADYDLGDRVEVLGRVAEADLLEYLRQSDVLLHLSRIDSYPLIVLEGMACSVLPVCLELAGARDQVETYGGHVVSPDNAVEEAADWIAAQDLDELRRQARAASVMVRRDYSWDRCAGALEEALLACLPPKHPATLEPSVPTGES